LQTTNSSQNPNLRRKASNKKHANKNRGEDTTSAKKNNSHTVGPVLLGFFLFVVVGSGKSRFDSINSVYINACQLIYQLKISRISLLQKLLKTESKKINQDRVAQRQKIIKYHFSPLFFFSSLFQIE